MLSAALALSIHAAVFSVPVRSDRLPGAAPAIPAATAVEVRTLPAATASSLPHASVGSDTPRPATALEGMAADRSSSPDSPTSGVSGTASPHTFGFALRLPSILGDDDFFSRASLDVGPAPILPVVIDYPAVPEVHGTHLSEASLFIDETGRVVRVRIDGPALPVPMEEAVRAAFVGALFSPGLVEGLPVRSKIRVEVVFDEVLPKR
jgi:hypothetical protein